MNQSSQPVQINESVKSASTDQRISKVSQYRCMNQRSQQTRIIITCAEDDDEGDESHGCDHNLEAATDNLTIKRHGLNDTKMPSRTSLY